MSQKRKGGGRIIFLRRHWQKQIGAIRQTKEYKKKIAQRRGVDLDTKERKKKYVLIV